ncbi:MAG: helix-hairpin-helix domain-containing protein [Marinospirillum sp.]|uniref:ComEA family DNA-binding protein n=1 Tax=Marinospirillum sp. TaxID=2183934 RepID=UPI0019DF0E00|nr:ComEA family DNA-binding protein [Marinospirillum sp.]MBE0506213.1 helix-hairpin-helix domain-containing protein [Marinospirillum sp.]
MQGIKHKIPTLIMLLLLLSGLNATAIASSMSESTQAVAQQASQRININHASAEQLAALPGIGPVKADAIITLREQKGGFTSSSELQEVRGIGSATVTRLEPLISF